LQQGCPFSLPVLILLLLHAIKIPASTEKTAHCHEIALVPQKFDPFILMVADLLMAPNLLVSKVELLLSSGASLRKANTTNMLLIKNLTLGILTPALLDDGSPTSPLALDSPMVALFLFLKQILAALQ